MKKLASRLLPILGFLFITAYIRSATVDVVYTDYIRIINTYLPDAWSFKPYLQPDILTRVPISYLERLISTYVFGYSTTFDMVMGALGLTFSAFVLTGFCNRRHLSLGVILAVLFLNFSLDKWEMLTNGTGWMHFWAFALFYAHYSIYDRVRGNVGAQGEAAVLKAGGTGFVSGSGIDSDTQTGADALKNKNTRRDEIALRVLPFVAILLFAGPYCAIYVGAMGIIYVIDYFTGRYDVDRTSKKDWIIRIVCLGVPFILFCISKYMSVEEYAGATDETLLQVIKASPALLPKMVLKSFASMVVGGETAMEYGISNKVLYLMGFFVIAGYVYAIYVNIKTRLYEKSAFPMLLIISGLISHAIVVWGRWIFKSPDYMMSSRYALQFQSGIIGIVLTLYMAWDAKKSSDAAKADGMRVSASGSRPGNSATESAASIRDENSDAAKADGMRNSASGSRPENSATESAASIRDENSDAAKADGMRISASESSSSTTEGSASDNKSGSASDGKNGRSMKTWERAARIAFVAVIIVGHLMTTGREINMAQYRKAAFENVREVALNYENETDATLKAVLQYSKPEMTRNALKILEDAHLNIFR